MSAPDSTSSSPASSNPSGSDSNTRGDSGSGEDSPADDGSVEEASARDASLSEDSFSDTLAENPELRRLAEEAVSYHEEALSENTRDAYASAWEDFRLFCREHDLRPLPAEPATVALYLSFLSKKMDSETGEVQEEGLAVPTIEQRLSAIAHYHEEAGRESPTSTRSVKNVMAGIRRSQKHRPEGARPLMTYHIKRMVDSLPKKAEIYAEKKRERAKTASGAELTGGEKRYLRLLEARNRALLLVGFAGALRRSEIAALRFEDLSREPGLGLRLDIRQSKTDQEGKGDLIYIRRLESEYDPVRALDAWREALEASQRKSSKEKSSKEKSSGLGQENSPTSGPVFRPITRGGTPKEKPITGRTVGNALQEAVRLAGISDPEAYSAHSLRAGHATQATKNGVPAEIAMQTTRHESREQFADYVRNDEEAFQDASSGKLGL